MELKNVSGYYYTIETACPHDRVKREISLSTVYSETQKEKNNKIPSREIPDSQHTAFKEAAGLLLLAGLHYLAGFLYMYEYDHRIIALQ